MCGSARGGKLEALRERASHPARRSAQAHGARPGDGATISQYAHAVREDVIFWKILEFWRTDRDP